MRGTYVVVCALLASCSGPAPIDAGLDARVDTAPADTPILDAARPEDHPDVALEGDATEIDAAACDGGGASETCNGLDDDCDGVVDDGCACVPTAPVTVGEGFHLGVALTSEGELATARQDFALGSYAAQFHGGDFGALSASIDLVVDVDRPQNDLSLFALGGDVGAIWRMPRAVGETEELFYARIDRATRTRALGPRSIFPDVSGSIGASAAPIGAGFVVARGERISALAEGVAVRFVDRDGDVTSGPHVVESVGTAAYTSVATAGDDIGVAYQTSTGLAFAIHFARFDAAGVPLGTPIDTTGLGVRPRVAGQASGWGLLWEGSDGIYFAALALDGTIRAAPRRIASGGAQGAAIAPDGDGGWGVVHRGDVGVSFVRLDALGDETGRAELADYSVDGSGSLVHDGARFIASVFGPASALWVPCVDP